MVVSNDRVDSPVMRDDLSALSWVQDEVRRSLELANKALRRYLKEQAQAVDLDSVDPAVLRQARSQLHQSVGVLELVGLGRAAEVLRAAEAALQRLSARPKLITPAAVEAIERGSFALLDFIARRLAGKPVSTLSLFPPYRALQELAGVTRAHPADLWSVEWCWRDLVPETGVPAATPDEATVGRIEADLLALMRGAPPGVAARMAELFASLAAGVQALFDADDLPDPPQTPAPRPPHPRLATLWQLAAGFFEAQADGLLQPDAYSKRIGSKLLAQLRAGVQAEPSEQLARDLLFFCSQAQPREGMPVGPRLAAIHQAYDLAGREVVDYDQVRLGRFDPAWLAQARKRVTAAKELWSAVAAGDLARLNGLSEPFALVSDSLARLYPDGGILGRALQVASAHTTAAGAEPPADLAMEVATALLYLEASIEDGDFDHPDGVQRIRRLAQRIDAVRQARDPGTLDLWMEELYRRVSDRQTMGSVVQELRASLSEVEQNIDHYFRNPVQREVLIPVPAQLSAMRGVLAVLGLDQASQAVLCMRDDVDALASTEVNPQHAIATGTFDRLADNLGALSFLIDMVSVQPQMAKSLFHFDPDSGVLSTVMARSDRPTGFDGFDARPAEPVAGPPDTDALAVSLEFDSIVTQARAARRAASASAPGLATGPEAAPGTPAQQPSSEPVLCSHGLPVLSPDSAPAAESGSPASRPGAAMSLSEEAVPSGLSGLEDDLEMREVFLEEAREVLQGAQAALVDWQASHGDRQAMDTVRRAFHTLKGSARMVGLADFGEAAWACEQLYNARLTEHGGDADPALRDFGVQAGHFFGRWLQALEAGQGVGFDAGSLVARADALRGGPSPDAPLQAEELLAPLPDRLPQPLSGRAADVLPAPQFEDTKTPGFATSEVEREPAAGLLVHVPDLPLAADLDLLFPPPEVLPPAAVPTGLPEFDLAGLTEPGNEALAPLIAVAEATELELSPDLDFELSLDLPEQAEAADRSRPAAALPALDLDSGLPGVPSEAVPAGSPEPETAPELEPEAYRQIGPLRIVIPLFTIYLNEADELSSRLGVELAGWAVGQGGAVGDAAVALAHSLAGNSGAVGYTDLSRLARALEHALDRSNLRGRGRGDEAELFIRASDEIRRLLHLFAAGFLNPPDADLLHALQALAHAAPAADTGAADRQADVQPEAGHEAAEPVDAEAQDAGAAVLGRAVLLPFAEVGPQAEPAAAELHAGQRDGSIGFDEDIDQVDAIDAELFPFLVEEAQELLPQLQSRLREWSADPAGHDAAAASMRSLHSLKGSARLAGAMRLGEMVHRLESEVQQRMAQSGVAGALPSASDLAVLVAHADALEAAFDLLRSAPAPATAAAVAVAQAVALPAMADSSPPPVTRPGMDWRRFAASAVPVETRPVRPAGAVAGSVRVRAPLLDRLVNQAGEVSIARARIESDLGQLKGGLGDLADNLARLRAQLRDIELQAETQIATRLEAARAAAQDFDPLEMDRFTRFQELTRVMAESVADVATVQRGLRRRLQSTEDALAHQARMTRDMQDDLLRTRMVEFESLSERLYRVVRQAAKETGKAVRLDIVGGAIEIDRGVLDRITPAFEHLLRNSVVHGIEPADRRSAAGKAATGSITMAVSQSGNEVSVEVRDDGSGLDLGAIRQRGLALGLIAVDARPDDTELANLIFQPGFSTAASVTDLAGRGVGMDVVRADVNAMGGRIETASAPGLGTSLRLVLPLTTAVTQVVMLRCGDRVVAVPSTLVETVRRVTLAELTRAYAHSSHLDGAQALPFFWLDALLMGTPRGSVSGRTAPVVIIRSAAQRVVLHVDEVLGNQEVVIKNLGPQLSRVPGLVGLTLLPSGLPALIYNPVALATLYGDAARQATGLAGSFEAGLPAAAQAPLVLVVDDSLTVRRITQRLLEREGYRVAVAKDGIEGLEKLLAERPAVLLTDIEMPRMDGFDLVRTLRADARLADLPVIMITSRLARKHRDYAAELGVDHYLGKPYVEDELLGLVTRHARPQPLLTTA